MLANGIVHALDLNGKALWTACIDAEQITGYGRSSSPLLCGPNLIVHMTNLYAFDAATGKQVWMNADAPSTYGSPTAAKVDGVDLIVTPNGEIVRAGDGEDPRQAESVLRCIPVPVAADGVVYFGESGAALTAVKLSGTA